MYHRKPWNWKVYLRQMTYERLEMISSYGVADKPPRFIPHRFKKFVRIKTSIHINHLQPTSSTNHSTGQLAQANTNANNRIELSPSYFSQKGKNVYTGPDAHRVSLKKVASHQEVSISSLFQILSLPLLQIPVIQHHEDFYSNRSTQIHHL
ncbi:hypothetical protein LXL04_026360 [Taraxacum kok-saghyz]